MLAFLRRTWWLFGLGGLFYLFLSYYTSSAVAPCDVQDCQYVPIVYKPEVTPTATDIPTATIPPTVTPSFNNCQDDPSAGLAPNFPIKIVAIDKASSPETVTLQNISSSPINLDGWIMCSITGNQRHTGISGLLGAGETKVYPYTGGGSIWNNTTRDDGALYTPQGYLVSYFVDQ